MWFCEVESNWVDLLAEAILESLAVVIIWLFEGGPNAMAYGV
jgi:hypothetical protein